jgi:hypothetical protein
MHPLAATLILLTGVTSLAQAPSAVRSESRASSVVLREIPVGTGCPIGFRADRQSTAQILTAGSAVYGLSPRSRILPADLLTSDADTTHIISKSFELQKSSNNETLSNADVWMSKAGALRWVDLTEIRYTNGTTWHPSASTKCRAIPSNFVLVGRR